MSLFTQETYQNNNELYNNQQGGFNNDVLPQLRKIFPNLTIQEIIKDRNFLIKFTNGFILNVYSTNLDNMTITLGN